MTSYISANNVSLTFRPKNRMPVTALNNFAVEVDRGQFVSIVGPSGCGKSTFAGRPGHRRRSDPGLRADRGPGGNHQGAWLSRSRSCPGGGGGRSMEKCRASRSAISS